MIRLLNIINEIEIAQELGLHEIATLAALELPKLCGNIAYPHLDEVTAYITWCKDNLYPDLLDQVTDKFNDIFPVRPMTVEYLYELENWRSLDILPISSGKRDKIITVILHAVTNWIQRAKLWEDKTTLKIGLDEELTHVATDVLDRLEVKADGTGVRLAEIPLNLTIQQVAHLRTCIKHILHSLIVQKEGSKTS